MDMFSVCPECGKEVTINEMPEPGKVLQGSSAESRSGTPVECPRCGTSFRPKDPYQKSA